MIAKRFLFIPVFLLLTNVYAQSNQEQIKTIKLDRSEIFPPEDGHLEPLKGKIIDGRYYSPKNVFSCQADDFGEGKYLSQDMLIERAACVGFYNSSGSSKMAEIMFFPGMEKRNLGEKDFKYMFESFAIGMLKKADNAQDIKILQEELLENNMFFVAISIGKTFFLRDKNKKYLSSTRGYLVFQEKDKIVFLSNQVATPFAKEHTPKKHVETIKKEILEFRNTFEFGPTPPIEGKTSPL